MNDPRKTLTIDEAMDILYKGNSLKDCFLDNNELVEEFKNSCQYFDLDIPLANTVDNIDKLISERINSWKIPDQYFDVDIKKFLISSCKTQEEVDRIEEEYKLFEDMNAINVLTMMLYIVHVAKKHNIVLGVGRGSSVASLCLYFLGVHKVHPLKHNLPLEDFFHG